MAELVRVSCSCFADFVIDGCMLGLINKSRAEDPMNPRRILSPLGGHYHYTDEGRAFLESIGASFKTKKNNEPDLDFTIPVKEVELVKRWFNQRKGREIEPWREIIGELTEENRLIPLDTEFHLGDYRTIEDRRRSDHTADAVRDTQYLFEIWSVEIPPPSEAALRRALQTSSDVLRLITDSDVARGSTDDGVPVASPLFRLLQRPTSRPIIGAALPMTS